MSGYSDKAKRAYAEAADGWADLRNHGDLRLATPDLIADYAGYLVANFDPGPTEEQIDRAMTEYPLHDPVHIATRAKVEFAFEVLTAIASLDA